MALNISTAQKASPVSIPAPIGGWNTRDSLDSMPPIDAVQMDNWIPRFGKVEVRKGYSSHSTGIGSGNVDFLAEYHAGSVRKLIAASSTAIYDASSATASSLGTGYTNGQWNSAQFNGLLIMVNGADTPVSYNGSVVANMTWTGPAYEPDGVCVFKNRLFFWKSSTQSFWYAPVDVITGALTEFSLNRVGQFGGNLMSVTTWTLDGGDGVDDLLVCVMSSGEVIVYQGTDPGSSTAWAMVGVYRIDEPLGIRGVVKAGGDLVVMTKSDFVSLSGVLKTGQIGASSKITGAVQNVSANSSLFGWQVVAHRDEQLTIFNIPYSSTEMHQYVLNMGTGAWCRWTGILSRAWCTYNEGLYFGSTDGAIYQYTTQSDNGDSIDATIKQAWTDLGSPMRKRVTAIRPMLSTEGSVNLSLGVGTDFTDVNLSAASVSVPGGTEWDTEYWDEASWSAELTVQAKWRVMKGMGYMISPSLRVSSKQEIGWLKTDLRIEGGVNL